MIYFLLYRYIYEMSSSTQTKTLTDERKFKKKLNSILKKTQCIQDSMKKDLIIEWIQSVNVHTLKN